MKWEKYLTKRISIFLCDFAYTCCFGIMFFNSTNLFSIQILTFGICFWKRALPWKEAKHDRNDK